MTCLHLSTKKYTIKTNKFKINLGYIVLQNDEKHLVTENYISYIH